MKDHIAIPGGELEYAVLVTLWELRAATAKEIHARVGAPDGLVYTTTAKVLDRLHVKGLVSRRRSGKAFVYEPTLDRKVVEGARAKSLLSSMLGGQPRPAMATLVEAVESIDPELVDELARLVAARRKSRHGS